MKHISKKLIAALCCMIIAFAMIVSASADNTISRVDVLVNTPPTKGRPSDAATAEAITYGTRTNSYKWYNADGSEVKGNFGKEEITFELIVEAADGFVFSGTTEVYLNDEYNYATVSTDGKYVTVKKAVVPGTYAPEIKKQPGDENIDADSLASFVATALYTSKANTWIIVSPDGNKYDPDSISGVFPNSGAETKDNGQKLNIHHVDSGMNGYRAYCVFYGDGQTVISNPAYINLNGFEKPVNNLRFSGGNYDAPAAPAAEASEFPQDVPVDVVVAGMTEGETAVSVVDIPADHQHEFGINWKYDNFGHWHECMCGETSDFASHDFVVINVTKPTFKEPGQDYKECKICTYGVDVEVPAKEIPLGIDSDTIKTVIISVIAIVLIIVFFSAYRNHRDNRRAERRKSAKRVEAEVRSSSKKVTPQKKSSDGRGKKPSQNKKSPVKKASAKKASEKASPIKSEKPAKKSLNIEPEVEEDMFPVNEYPPDDFGYEPDEDDYDVFADDDDDSGFDFDRFR